MAAPLSRSHPGVTRGFIQFARVIALLMLLAGAWEMLSGTKGLLPGVLGWVGLTREGLEHALMHARAGPIFFLSGLSLLFFLTRARYAKLVVGVNSVVTLSVVASSLQQEIISPLEAAGFLLLALQGLLADEGRGRIRVLLKDAASLLLLAIAMTGLAAYGFSLGGESSSRTLFSPIEMPVAWMLLLAALAWMSAQPDQGMTRIATADSFGGALARRLLLPSLLLPLLFSYVMQLAKIRFHYSESMMTSLAALFTGGSVATLIWWAATLVDRVERERREVLRMRESAESDGLTGLPNRRAFDNALGKLLRGHREQDARFCLLMLDLDCFKAYNDSFGHLAGDDALRITAQLLRDAVRPGDVAARYGGEEFSVLLPDSTGDSGLQIAERIVELFRQEHWPHRPVTVSIGVAEAQQGDDACSLIARADAALYSAKREGRDRVVRAAKSGAEKKPIVILKAWAIAANKASPLVMQGRCGRAMRWPIALGHVCK